MTVGISIAGQEQDRNTICGSSRSGSNHIHCAGTNTRRASVHLLTAFLLSKAHCRMSHTLFIATHAHNQIAGIFFESLPHADNVAVSKNAEDTFKHFIFLAVEFNVLIVEELNEGLRHRKSNRFSHYNSPLNRENFYTKLAARTNAASRFKSGGTVGARRIRSSI